MSRQVLMQIIDDFIDTAIDRLSCEDGVMVSYFYLDVREIFPDRQRITQNLIDSSIDTLESRGLIIERVVGTTINITVNLHKCLFNHYQSKNYSVALSYVRNTHGQHL